MTVEDLSNNAWQLFVDTVVAHKYLQEAPHMEITSESVIKTLSYNFPQKPLKSHVLADNSSFHFPNFSNSKLILNTYICKVKKKKEKKSNE